MRMSRRAAPGEIVRRGDRDLTQVRTESDGDHVLLDDFADADRGVIAARHDIHDLVVQRQVEHDVGVRVMKGSQQRPQAQVRGRPEAMNANDAGRARAQLACLSDRDTEFLQRRPDLLEQPVAGLGQGDTSSVPMEQADPNALLEPANHLAQRRSGDAELLGRSSEIERLGDCDEGAELAEVGGGEKGFARAHRRIA